MSFPFTLSTAFSGSKAFSETQLQSVLFAIVKNLFVWVTAGIYLG